jgi:hypothetical protein
LVLPSCLDAEPVQNLRDGGATAWRASGRQRFFFGELDHFVLPDIFEIAPTLLFDSRLNYLRVFKPPGHPGAVAGQGFGPELVAVALQRGEVQSLTPDGPKAAATRLILEPRFRIRCSDENALPWYMHQTVTVRKPEALSLLTDESLFAGCFRPAERAEFREFDYLDTAHLHCSIFRSHLSELIREPLADQDASGD